MPDPAPPSNAASVLAQEFKVSKDCSVQVDVPEARTRLRPATTPGRVSVDVTISGTSDASADTVADHMGLATRQVQNTIRIVGASQEQAPAWWRWRRRTDAQVYLDVQVPSPVDASVRVPGGTLVVSGLEGTFDLTVPGGAVRLQQLSRPVALQARRSPVEIEKIEGPRLSLRSAAAPMQLTDIDSSELTIEAAAAPVTIQKARGTCQVEAHAAPVSLTDLSGPCRAVVHRGPLRFVGPVRAKTSLTTIADALSVSLPSSSGAALDATGTSVRLDEAFSFAGDREAPRLQGALNGGGPALTLRAVRGTVECQAA